MHDRDKNLKLISDDIKGVENVRVMSTWPRNKLEIDWTKYQKLLYCDIYEYVPAR